MKREKFIDTTHLCKIAICIVLLCSLLSMPNAARSATVSEEPAQKMLHLINEERKAYALPAYLPSPILQQAAQTKLDDMMRLNYFAHESPTYGDVRNLLAHFGLNTHCSENIARYGSLEKAHAALMTSPSHRRNILARGFNAVGIAAARLPSGGYMVVQIFARV